MNASTWDTLAQSLVWCKEVDRAVLPRPMKRRLWMFVPSLFARCACRRLSGCGRGLSRRAIGLRRLANHDDIRDVGRDLPTDDPVNRAGLYGILVENHVNLRSRGGPAVAKHTLGLYDPLLLASSRPESFTVPTVGIEEPRLDLAGL